MLWKIKLVRVLCFYLTGLDFLQAKNHSLFAAAFAKVNKNAGHSIDLGNESSNKPVRFTYVIYENQRRWLGIGWTSNLLSYERTPWTDEFLNESSSIESFQLPNNENQGYSFGPEQSLELAGRGTSWRWVDKTWRLDITNDGAITLKNNKRSKTTANPTTDEGYIYYDNTWKKPSTEDSFSKYTRRRRWIRTAELIFDNSTNETPTSEEQVDTGASAGGVSTTGSNTKGSSSPKKRKSIRFAETSNESTDSKSDSKSQAPAGESSEPAEKSSKPEEEAKEADKDIQQLIAESKVLESLEKKSD